MRIRTLLATALLASSAVLGAAGMAAADDEGSRGSTPGSGGSPMSDNMWGSANGGGMPGDMLGSAGSGSNNSGSDLGGAGSGFNGSGSDLGSGAGNGVLGSTSFR
ncbi:hypothetical protein ACIRPT_07630 [Streptomyces sp. NPDC101227]|uniref:hypothetical protein n=1 Tax=Streptomyces sp. NPDC101227 TaxID=3366136 RepID=UPI0038252F4A